MGRRQIPQPEGPFIGTDTVFVLVVSALAVILLLIFRTPWLAITLLPLAFWTQYKAYGLVLLLRARSRWRNTPICGILVYSDSPNWKEYIESSWLSAIAGRVVVLNWSERKSWDKSLPVRLFRYYVTGRWGDYEIRQKDINPAFILFRGLRYPHVYRYHQAFRDRKHGHPEALRQLEDRMFAEIDRS